MWLWNTESIIPMELQAFASQNQLFIGEYKNLHHENNYSKGKTFTSQNQLSRREYKLLHRKTNYSSKNTSCSTQIVVFP